MSNKVAANFFMVFPLETNIETHQGRFYQELIKGLSNYEELGKRLVVMAEHALAFRQFDQVKGIAQVLMGIPVQPYRSIGMYFIGVALNGGGRGDQAAAKLILERSVEAAPDSYKAKALLSLAAVSYNSGDHQAAASFYAETIKAGGLSSATVHALRSLAIIKGIEGDHDAAVRDLEEHYLLVRHAPAIAFFNYLNSFAVELGEVGRLSEARNMIRLVLASPFAPAYPEWRETAQELKSSRRSMVTIEAMPYNVLAMPEREQGEQILLQPKRARVLNFARLKKKMDKKDKDQKTKKAVEDMTKQDLGWELIGLINENNPSEEQLRQLVYFAMTLFSEPDDPSA